MLKRRLLYVLLTMYMYNSSGFFERNKSDFSLGVGERQRQKSTVRQSFILSVFLLILVATTVFALGSNITGNLIVNETDNVDDLNITNDTVHEYTLSKAVIEVQNISQNTTNVLNETNVTDSEENATLPGMVPEENITENESALPLSEFPQYNESNETLEEEDVTTSELNESLTVPEENVTINETQENVTTPEMNETQGVELPEGDETEINITIPEKNVTNATLPNENATQPENESVEEPEEQQSQQPAEVNETIEPEIPIVAGKTQLDIELVVPQKITRGEVVSLQAVVRNIGDVNANDVIIRWSLPSYFVSSDDLFKGCGTVTVGSYCEHNIEVVVTQPAKIGLNEIKVFVEYE
ncbi:MAG: hypothetical protein ACTSX6_11240 [Candidatus Heimdallarchaeaceae archaeon]